MDHKSSLDDSDGHYGSPSITSRWQAAKKRMKGHYLTTPRQASPSATSTSCRFAVFGLIQKANCVGGKARPLGRNGLGLLPGKSADSVTIKSIKRDRAM